MANKLINADCLDVLPSCMDECVHLFLSDIPYGICVDKWDVLHQNANSALLGASPAQKKAGKAFLRRGKPLNGWSAADKEIPKQYQNWCDLWAKQWLRLLKPGGSAFIFAGRRMSHRCIASMEDTGFILKDTLAWVRSRALYRAQRISEVFIRRGDIASCEAWRGWRVGNLRPNFEPILWFMKPYKVGGTIADNVIQNHLGAFNDNAFVGDNKSPSNVLFFQHKKNDRGLHPTQKPLALMRFLVELTTIKGQVVCDPFCGSGTTLLAAAEFGREFLGIERDERYFQIASTRLKNHLE